MIVRMVMIIMMMIMIVQPAFEEFCIPTKKYADVIIPRGAENVVALDLIKQHIEVMSMKHNIYRHFLYIE